MAEPDVLVVNCGTVWTFEAVSETAVAWIEEYVSIEPWQGTARAFTADWAAGARPRRADARGWPRGGLI